MTKYLLEQRVPLAEKVATALLYGIETEVTGFPREASPADDEALIQLYPLADKDLLAQIRNARLPHSHFECILQALQSSFIYDRLIVSWVNPLPATGTGRGSGGLHDPLREGRLGCLLRRL